MTKKSVEERLLASAKQALAIKRGKRRPSQTYDLPLTARQAVAERPPAYTSDAIARIRDAMKLVQALFAEALNVSLGTVRSWEQGIRFPDGAASRLLQVAERDPGALTSFLQPRDDISTEDRRLIEPEGRKSSVTRSGSSLHHRSD